MSYGIMELRYVIIRPPRVHSFATLGEVLREAAAKRPAGEWVLARGYQEFDEGRWPNREDLDRLLPKTPSSASTGAGSSASPTPWRSRRPSSSGPT